jgi:hypothetical protein
VHLGGRGDLEQLIAGIVVHKDRLIVRLKSDNVDEASDCPDGQSLTIPWQKPPSKRSREILLPHNASRSEVRPEQFERRARLVSAIARGRRWLDDVVSGRVTTVAQLCTREKCSVRQLNMTISLAFRPILSKQPSKVAYPAVSVSSGSVIRRLNGAGNLRRSDSIQNNCRAGPRSQLQRPKSRNCGAARSKFALKARLPGTEFSDAETGRQKPSRKSVNAWRDQNPGSEWPEIPQKSPIWRRIENLWFAKTGWWCAQSDTNRSPPPNSQLTGKIQGNFAIPALD